MSTDNVISRGVNYILDYPGVPMWMKILALAGALTITMSMITVSGKVISGIAYIIGTVKWIIYKLMGKQI